MSEENVKTVHRWFEALSREDPEAALGLLHRDVVLVPPGGQAPHRGIEGLRRWMQPEAFPGQIIQPLETVIVTDRTILGRQQISARGRASGIELDVVSWSVWTFDEDGLVTRIEIYLDHEKERAYEAAGLSE